jgi:uncharacterized cupredoxin-like copper-binding protein
VAACCRRAAAVSRHAGIQWVGCARAAVGAPAWLDRVVDSAAVFPFPPSARSLDHRPLDRAGGLARATVVLALLVAVLGVAGCDSGSVAPPTPLPSAGSVAHPREVNLIMHDYSFTPDPVDVVPGETVLLHVVNAGLETHEAVIGDQSVQDAWEIAEAATVGAPPGPTPVVSVPPGVAGLRVVVPSGGRADVLWTVPASPSGVRSLLIGCHIPGHYAKGMKASVRVAAASPDPTSSPGGGLPGTSSSGPSMPSGSVPSTATP